jgi:hypothetical protein
MPVKKIYNIYALVLTAYLLPGHLSAQPDYFFEGYGSGIYGILDRHFRGVLFPEVYKRMPSAKVAYPGLWEADRADVCAGFLPDQIANSGGLGWNALYAYTDIDLSPGSAGLWLGNVNAESSFRIFEFSDITGAWDTDALSLRGAFWVSPRQNDRFRGVSAVIDVDNFYAYNGNDFEGLYDNKSYYLNITALVRLSGDYHLKFAVGTRNEHADNPEDTRLDNRKLFTDAVSVGLLDGKLRTLELRAWNVFALNNADEKSDTLALALRYTQGGAVSYMKHTLFLGITADAGAAYPSKISQRAGSFHYYHYLRRMTDEGRVASAGVSVPIVADISLYRGLRCMLSIRPGVSYTNISPRRAPENSLYLNPQHRFAAEMPDAELSLRGTVGDRIDFILMPSIKNNVFLSALEVRYLF